MERLSQVLLTLPDSDAAKKDLWLGHDNRLYWNTNPEHDDDRFVATYKEVMWGQDKKRRALQVVILYRNTHDEEAIQTWRNKDIDLIIVEGGIGFTEFKVFGPNEHDATRWSLGKQNIRVTCLPKGWWSGTVLGGQPVWTDTWTKMQQVLHQW